MRKRQMALTEAERQILLAELTEIAAELDRCRSARPGSPLGSRVVLPSVWLGRRNA
jgi:hypothetical protein